MNKCDHVELVAKRLYYTFRYEMSGSLDWEALREVERKAWRRVAKDAPSIIANHALDDLKVLAKEKAGAASGVMKWVWWVVAVLGVVLGSFFGVSSCTGVDSLILQGEKGQVRYYQSPEGEKVIVLSPVEISSRKK